jgi:hypothetical protein
MAIERQTPNVPQSIEEQELLQELDDVRPDDEAGFVMMEDGSAVLEEDTIEVEEQDNLAETLSDQLLNKISSDLMAGVEADKSSRSDWEKTYTDGLQYLGMKFDEDRSEPFEGASGVIHPLLGEAVTQFQAQVQFRSRDAS